MAQPDRSGPKVQTLLELAESKRQEMMAKHPEAFGLDDAQNAGEEKLHKNGDWEFMSSEPLGPFGDALVYTVSFAMLHFTLDVLVYSQYRQEIVFAEIFSHLIGVVPALFFSIYILHTPTAMKLKWVRQALFWTLATGAGCWLIKAGNKDGYYAVMSRAPPLGTVWVWCVIEMELMFDLVHVGVVGAYTYVNGFTTF